MGLIILNKSSGITSFDALKEIKKELKTSKVGHTGTLDKFAQGLMLVLTERDLKLARWFSNCDKQYIGRIKFGIETDTLDPEGEIISQAPLPSLEDVEHTLGQFTGDIMQAPPAYSAIHVNGKRASELARSGETPEMKKRPVTVYKLELRLWEPPFADIFVRCSSGTYIRSLARDIALACGSRGHLVSLIRTQIAGFKLPSETRSPVQVVDKTIISLLGMPWFEVTEKEAVDIKHGKPLLNILQGKTPCLPECISEPYEPHAAAVFCEEDLIAFVENQDGKWKYGAVLNNQSL